MADLVTPCHGIPFFAILRWKGLPYLDYEVVDEYMCTADKCYNSWDENGKDSGFNVYNDSAGLQQ